MQRYSNYNISRCNYRLWGEEALADVILATGDHHQIPAHKVPAHKQIDYLGTAGAQKLVIFKKHTFTCLSFRWGNRELLKIGCLVTSVASWPAATTLWEGILSLNMREGVECSTGWSSINVINVISWPVNCAGWNNIKSLLKRQKVCSCAATVVIEHFLLTYWKFTRALNTTELSVDVLCVIARPIGQQT